MGLSQEIIYHKVELPNWLTQSSVFSWIWDTPIFISLFYAMLKKRKRMAMLQTIKIAVTVISEVLKYNNMHVLVTKYMLIEYPLLYFRYHVLFLSIFCLFLTVLLHILFK